MLRTAVVVGLLLAIAMPGPAQSTVSAVLLRPWAAGAPNAFWTDLVNNYANYGGVPVTVDQTTFATAFSPATLLAANPDVIIMANPGGGNQQYTITEMNAIQQFLAIPGKRAIATFKAFNHNATDNTWMLPLFGLTPMATLPSNALTTPNVTQFVPHPLMNNIPPTFATGGYQFAQTPPDASWDPNDYQGLLVAAGPNNRGVIHYWTGVAHDAIFISFMPEYGGNTDDSQLVYNCLTWAPNAQAAIVLGGPPVIGTTLTLNLASQSSGFDPYLIALSQSAFPGIPLPSGRIVPLTPDPLFQLTTGPNPFLVNNSGAFNGSGTANPAPMLLIPNDPGLIGETVYAAFVTFNAAAPDGLSAISPPVAITAQ